MKFWLSVFRAHIAPLFFLTCLVVLLAVVNYTPNTLLTGWDNLHPEFNFGLNIGRSLSAAWQEYQGVGLLGGMSHAADLTRQLFLLALSVVIPNDLLRYAWVWVTWWLGTIGTYLLCYQLLRKHRHDVVSQTASTAAAIFYLLNLATIQYFYVPYESFSSFYGFLPWLLFGVLRYFDQPTVRRLLQLFLITVAATSAFYVQTLFVVFVILLGILSLSSLFTHKITLKQCLLAGAVILAANLFWLLPSAYFTVTSSQVTVNSKVNRLSTKESQLMNQTYGTPLNIMLLKGYWFSYQDFQNNTYDYLIPEWRDHVQQGSVVIIGIGCWVIAVVGLMTSVKNDKKWQPTWVISFIVVTIMLTSGNGPLGVVFTWASDHIPLFGQIFRTAFTKWSTAAALIYAIGIAYFTLFMLSKAKQAHRFLAVSWLGIVTTSLLWFMWPTFQGQLIAPIMRLKHPQAYQELFTFFSQQPKQTRIAVLPLADFWAWTFHNWNYRGSGFLWYGIEQPLLDRNFDVWSPLNETFYNEISTAIYGEDAHQLQAILRKYNVSYLLIDESIQLPKKDAKALNVDLTRNLLTSIGAKPVWGKDFLSVYQLPGVSPQFVTAPAQYTPLWEETKRSRIDPALRLTTSYTLGTASQLSEIFPFAELAKEDLPITAESKDFSIEKQLPHLTQPSTLIMPPAASGSAYSAKVIAERENNEVVFTFTSEGTVTVGDQTRPLPTLPSLRLPVETPLTLDTKLSATLNGQPVSLASGSARSEQWVSLTVADPITVKGDIVSETQIERIEFNFPAEIWENLTEPMEIPVPAGDHKVRLYVANQWITVPIAQAQSLNCDVFKRGSFDVASENGRVTYTTGDNASICSGIALPVLHSQMAGFLQFSGENRSGRSIKFYVTVPSAHRAILEEVLGEEEFINTFTLLDWQRRPIENYGLNWETRSFGENAVNSLRNVSVLPFNVRRVVDMRIQHGNSAPVTNTVSLSNNWKVGTYQYGTQANVQGNGLLTLSQGYDAGWVAFAVPQSGGESIQILPHLVYNGWANGWQLSPGTYQVVILYVPQLLEFGGLFILALSCVTLAILSLTKKSQFA